MHFDRKEIIEFISTLALLETEAKAIRKTAKEQGPISVSIREKEAYYIEMRARMMKDDLIRRIS